MFIYAETHLMGEELEAIVGQPGLPGLWILQRNYRDGV